MRACFWWLIIQKKSATSCPLALALNKVNSKKQTSCNYSFSVPQCRAVSATPWTPPACDDLSSVYLTCFSSGEHSAVLCSQRSDKSRGVSHTLGSARGNTITSIIRRADWWTGWKLSFCWWGAFIGLMRLNVFQWRNCRCDPTMSGHETDPGFKWRLMVLFCSVLLS